MTGHGTSAQIGLPDVGLASMAEMVANLGYIVNAVDVPVVADADTGYGNAINAQRTVREYESAGAAAMHLEDQIFPKRCGFFEGKECVPMDEHVQKIRAALDARINVDMVIIARTDAVAPNGWDDAIRRAEASRIDAWCIQRVSWRSPSQALSARALSARRSPRWGHSSKT